MRDSLLFTQRAADCRSQAAAAELDNVRERCLRAEAAWTAMAMRSAKVEQARDTRERRQPEEAGLPPVPADG